MNLSADIALVKAALLYADSVELVSPGASMLSTVGALEGATPADTLEILRSLSPEVMERLGGKDLTPDVLQALQAIAAFQALPRQARRDRLGRHQHGPEVTEFLAKAGAVLGSSAEELRTVATGIVERSGRRELDEPIKLGLVQVTDIASIDDPEGMMEHYLDHLKRSLRDPAIHALFDEASASLARSLVREGHVEPNRTSLVHAREAAVGGGLVSRLPSFPNSAMDEVLELRSDLDKPLSRYRRAVAGLAATLQSDMYERELSVEIDDLWRNNVAPTLDDLREGLEQSTLLRTVAKQLSQHPKAVAAGVAGVGALVTGMGPLSEIYTAVGGGTTASTAATHLLVQGAAAQRKARAELRGHDLFYLHEVNDRLVES